MDKIRSRSLRSPTLEMALWLELAIFYFLQTEANAFFTSSKCMESMSEEKLYSDCRSRGLVNTFDMHLDPATRVLYLANNEFTRLRNDEFQSGGLNGLEELYLQENQIEKIERYAFNGLHVLRFLDLSKNRIQTFELAFLPPLIMLNLSFNNFSPGFPVLPIHLPQVLDLFSCNLKELPIHDNHYLSSLQHLNLSFNNIKKLPLQLVQRMSLKSIQTLRNPLYCNEETQNLDKWFENNNVQFSPICLRQTQTQYPWNFVKHDAARPHILPAHNVYPIDQMANSKPEKCLEQVETLLSEQRLFAIITLSMNGLTLIVIGLLTLVLVIRCRHRKQESEATPDFEDEVPPPPYRTYASGFSV